MCRRASARPRRRHDFAGLLAFLLVAHGAALAPGKIFHSHYLVWLVPLVELALLAGLGQPIRSVRARTAIGGRAGTASPGGAILDGERVA